MCHEATLEPKLKDGRDKRAASLECNLGSWVFPRKVQGLHQATTSVSMHGAREGCASATAARWRGQHISCGLVLAVARNRLEQWSPRMVGAVEVRGWMVGAWCSVCTVWPGVSPHGHGHGWQIGTRAASRDGGQRATPPRAPDERWRLEAGVWRMQSGGCSLESGVWCLEAEGWRLESGGCSLESEVWSLEPGAWSRAWSR